MAQQDLASLQNKVATAMTEAYGKYQSHASLLSNMRRNAQQYEFMCNVVDLEMCVQKYEAFKPSIYAAERNIAKKFRDCAKGCTANAPRLLQLNEHQITQVEEMRRYEAAAKCFSQCVDSVFSDFKRAEQEIKDKYAAMQKEFPLK